MTIDHEGGSGRPREPTKNLWTENWWGGVHPQDRRTSASAIRAEAPSWQSFSTEPRPPGKPLHPRAVALFAALGQGGFSSRTWDLCREQSRESVGLPCLQACDSVVNNAVQSPNRLQ